MTNSKQPLPPPSERTKRRLGFAILAAGAIGLLDATYLTVQHYLHGVVPCTNIGDCEKVLTSEYSSIGPVPVALLGALYYTAVVLLSVLYLNRKDERFLKAVARISVVGFAASAWFVALQLFVIKAICIYCMTSATTSTAIFGCGLAIMLRERRAKTTAPGNPAATPRPAAGGQE